MKLPIKGLLCTTVDEAYYFYNEQLLANNVIIKYETLVYDDDNPNVISVKHYNELNAGEWFFYWGDYLEHIQIYRIIKDIFDLFNEHPFSDFAQFLDDLSTQSYSSSMQSNADHKRDIYEEIKVEIESVKVF